MDMIEYAGVTSQSLGIILPEYYGRKLSTRRVTTKTIPGKHGSIIEDEEVYDNYTDRYTLYWLPEQTSDDQVFSWLRQDGYHKLVDSRFSEVYRMARVTSVDEVENHRDCYHETEVSFDCQPQAFLFSGQEPVEVSTGAMLFNPTGYKALPLLEITGTGAGQITIGEIPMEILGIPNGTLFIDCDIQNAYDSTGYQNGKISALDFPFLASGKTQISWTGSITGIKVTPRWWKR